MNYADDSTALEFARSKVELQFEAAQRTSRSHVLVARAARDIGPSGRLEAVSDDLDIPDVTRDLYAVR